MQTRAIRGGGDRAGEPRQQRGQEDVKARDAEVEEIGVRDHRGLRAANSFVINATGSPGEPRFCARLSGAHPLLTYPMDIEQKTLEILSEVTGMDAAKLDPDIELYDRGLMDSMTTVQLIASLSEQFNLDISPAEFDRDAWATPRLLVADIQHRCNP